VIDGLRVPVHLTSREALRMFNLADIWSARTGEKVRLVSANDHVHMRRSSHYAGLALDFHSSNPDGLADLFRHFGYQVLWKVPGHYAHIHVEPTRSERLALLRRESGKEQRQASAIRAGGRARVGG